MNKTPLALGGAFLLLVFLLTGAGRQLSPASGQPLTATYLPLVTIDQPADLLFIDGYVRLGDGDGPGLAGVAIYRSIAVYDGYVVATTDSRGYYRIAPLNTQGHRETIGVWALLPGYTFAPDRVYWSYYGHREVRRIDFVASAP